MSLQQGSMFDMTVVRSYTHEQHDSDGACASRGRGSGDFVNSLQDAARENPVSAALIGMGVLWLFMGGSNTSLFGGGRKSILHKAASYPEHAVSDVGSTFRQVADNPADAASQIGGAVRQAST